MVWLRESQNMSKCYLVFAKWHIVLMNEFIEKFVLEKLKRNTSEPKRNRRTRKSNKLYKNRDARRNSSIVKRWKSKSTKKMSLINILVTLRLVVPYNFIEKLKKQSAIIFMKFYSQCYNLKLDIIVINLRRQTFIAVRCCFLR